MTLINRIDVERPHSLDRLVLCDRLLTLADEVERAGLPVAANHLLYLALQVIDDPISLKG